MKPTSGIVAVTLNCNAGCRMCDIWRQRSSDEMRPGEYLRLPASLKDINVTGGEPFLRRDLLQILTVIKQTCPRARLVISTNGLLLDRIRGASLQLAGMSPSVAVRISIDGIGELHDRLRGVPHAFTRALQALQILREAEVRDLGIGMTVVQENVGEVTRVYRLAEELGVEFSVTIASDSPIFFGSGKSMLRPRGKDELVRQFECVIEREYRSAHPKRWLRAWFERELLSYALEGKRSLPCDAAQGFFYLDPYGTVYCCHMLPHRLGSLRQDRWQTLWESPEAERVRQELRGCDNCWMVCTARTQMKRHLLHIAPQLLGGKIRAHVGRKAATRPGWPAEIRPSR